MAVVTTDPETGPPGPSIMLEITGQSVSEASVPTQNGLLYAMERVSVGP